MRTTYLTVSALILAGTAFGADPRLLNLVMPNPTSLAGANVTNAEITPFGQYILSQINANMNQEFQTFVTATGFDPRQDVSEILAASSSTAANPSGLVLAIGTFQVPQITAAIVAKAPQFTVTTYGSATLITGTSKAQSFSVAFIGTTIAIVGDTPSVKAAIDRSAGVNSLPPALAVQVQTLSTTEDAWAVTDSPITTLIPGLTTPAAPGTTTASPFGTLFSSIQGSSGGIKFGTTVQITGQAVTTDAASASALAGVLQMISSFAAMAGGQGPEGASIVQILQSLKVTTDGPDVNIALSIPETQIEGILNDLKQQAKPVVKSTIRPAVQIQ